MRCRTGLVASVVTAVATVAFVAGCSAGQVTQTDAQVPPVPGANAEAPMGDPPERIAVRNVHLVYSGPAGYAEGGSAPVEARIFNDTAKQVVVRISSPDASGVVLGSSAPSPSAAAPPTPTASPSAGASPSARASASPSPKPAASPSASASVEITIPVGGVAVLAPGAARGLTLVGLKKAVKPGDTLTVVFAVTDGPTLTVKAPITPPLTPLPRTPLVIEESGHA
ncbi:MAG TPA: hypothetical protein VFC00_22945 [Micromonosporaceae bacterium]|nr:hypothetical protein [Micromonosporaceae bacterium]